MKGYKTVIASLVVALSGWFATPEMVEFLRQYPEWVSTVIGAIFLILRGLTTTKIGKKDAE